MLGAFALAEGGCVCWPADRKVIRLLQRFRFSTSVLFTAAVSLEYLTPLMPRYFLPLASVANVGKSVGLTTYIATQPVFLNSFIRCENLADINAKTQVRFVARPLHMLWLFTAGRAQHHCM